ncbi:glyoxylate/hydroxypyruvate reductase A [Acetobacter musti]|uniref:Glyoxylate/hydroxypyruvate reductase A n=1 Tax=Acetobacter musti TaxID=864732 RepID=A0ABX0JPU7_9PROT|nr:glyoxylate/hydroxypyruvate reductase A [Acetobacter musti]NHN85478.1 glyoxylate/hydroxypyruvate reductase A [Acetobacter musti]
MSFVIMTRPDRAAVWKRVITAGLPEETVEIWPDVADPEAVEFLAAWTMPDDLITLYPNLKVLFSVGAGVDQLDLSRVPAGVQVVRMIEPGLTEGMVSYARYAVTTIHRGMLRYIAQQRTATWKAWPYPPASEVTVGVMGLGELGLPVAQDLLGAGYACRGWARSRREVDGIETFAGEGELDAFLSETTILICLLPLTPATAGILSASLFDRLPDGAGLVHCGRGGQLVTADLIAALDRGRIGAAVIDVTEPEPLPPESALWSHPNVLITPHIASMTQAETSARSLVDNIARYRSGRAMRGAIDLTVGY